MREKKGSVLTFDTISEGRGERRNVRSFRGWRPGSRLNSERIDSFASRSLTLAPRASWSMSLDSRRLHSRGKRARREYEVMATGARRWETIWL